MPALNDAISQRRFKQVYFLMNYGVDLNQRNLTGKTALMQLCELEPEETAFVLAKGLVKRGARIELSDQKGRNSLVYAILHQREKLASYFLEEAINYDFNAKDCDGNTPLAHAAAVGNLELVRPIVQLLKKFRLSVDVPNNRGETPLMRASKNGHIFCAKFILSEGKASRYMRDNSCWKTALEWEESLRFENLGLESLFSAKKEIEDKRSNSASIGSKQSVIATRQDTSLSLYKPRTSQRQEIERLFDVYKDQFSSTYRKGYTNRKSDETLNNENEPFDSSLDKDLEDQFEEDILEKSTSSGSSTRRLFAKGAAIVKFKKGSTSRGYLTRTSTSLAASFPPGHTITLDNVSLIEKLSQTKLDSPSSALNRPRHPARSKSEMNFNSICRLTKDNPKKFNSKQSNKLPRIALTARRKTELSMSTVLEDEENENELNYLK